jgi:hypothetical protein
MEMIQKMPHVCADLEEISRCGANREIVVGFLETVVIARTSSRTGKTLKEKEATLRKLAGAMSGLAVRVGQVVGDPMSTAESWTRALGYRVEEALACPTDTVKHMEEYAKWAERNAQAISHLRSTVRQTQNTGGIYELFRYVKKSTGKNHTALLARLLNAAHDALSANDSSSEESLKKLVARHPERLRQQAKEIQNIESLLRTRRDK